MLIFLAVDPAWGDAGITYHGRLLKPDGEPVTRSAVQFLIQIRTPSPSSCLMYQETQVKDLSQSRGVFSITINDGSQTQFNTEPFNLEEVFRNHGRLHTFPAGKCSGVNAITFDSALGRQISVSFNDGTFSGWEPLPAQAINFVPSALETVSVGGRTPENLFRVEDAGVPQIMSPWSSTNYQKLLDLMANTTISGGNASIGGNAAGFTGSLSGDVTGGQASTKVEKIQGNSVLAGTPSDKQVLTWNHVQSRWEPANVPVAGNPDWNDITNKPAGTATGQVMQFEVGVGWKADRLLYTDLIKSGGGSPWPSAACVAGEAIIWQSATDGFECAPISITESDPSVKDFAKADPSSDFDISGGNLVLKTVPITRGGTGAVSQSDAINNLLPTQGPHAGKILQTDGTNVSWADAPASGVTSINGATGSSQIFNVAQGETAPVFKTTGNTHTLNIPQASTSGVTAGTISYTDYQNFSGKQNALGFTPLNLSNNLSELTASASTARANLGLGTAATKNFGTSSGNLVELDVSNRIPASLLPDQSGLYFKQGGNGLGAPAVFGTTDAQPLHLQTGGTNKVTVLENGNVGVGVETPLEKLEVAGHLKISGSGNGIKFPDGTSMTTAAVGGGSAGSAVAWVSFNGSGTILSSFNISSVSKSTTGRFVITFANTLPDANYAVATGGLNTGIGDGGWVSVYSATGSPKTTSAVKVATYSGTGGFMDYPETYVAIFSGSGTAPIASGQWIESGSSIYRPSGNVGIGTVTPTAKLEVEGSFKISGVGNALIFPDGTSMTTASASGGGGTWAALSLSDTNNFDPQCEYVMNGFRASTVTSSSIMAVVNSVSGSTTANWYLINAASKGTTYSAQDNYSNNLYYGGSATTSLYYRCGSGTTGQWTTVGGGINYSVGNVGVGTTTPSEKLEVDGNIKISGTGNGIKFPDGTILTTAAGSGGGSGDGSALTNLNASELSSGTVPADRMPALTGDVTATVGTTTTTLSQIQGKSLTISTPTAGDYLKYNGTGWVNDALSSADLSDASGLIKASQMPANCAAGETLTFSSPTGAWVCSAITNLDAGVIATGTIDAARLPASATYWTSAVGGINYAGGNIGIGTTTPNSALTVNGMIQSLSGGIQFPDGTIQTTSAMSGTANSMHSGFPDVIRCNVTNPSFGPRFLYLNSVGLDGTVGYFEPWSGVSTYAGYVIYNADGTYNSMGFSYTTTDCNVPISTLYSSGRAWNIAKGPAGQWLQSGSNAYYNAGNVGIGTTSPGQKLTVDGTIESTSGGIKFPDGTTQSTAATTSSGGAAAWVNFVGTAAGCPAGNCTITASYNISSVTRLASGAYQVNFSSSLPNANYVVNINTQADPTTGYASTQPMLFRYSPNGTSSFVYVNPTTTAFVFGTPVQGVTNGTDNAVVQLSVFNSSGGSNTNYFTQAGSDIYYNTGNVGIGTTAPTAKLDVAGEVKFGNTSSACNSTNEGQQRYNSTAKNMEFCNGSTWVGLGGGGLGAGQSWTDVSGVRALSTNYTNLTGKPIQVSIILNSTATQQRSSLVIDGATIATITPSDYYSATAATNHYQTLTAIVPAGAVYSVEISSGTPTVISWKELR